MFDSVVSLQGRSEGRRILGMAPTTFLFVVAAFLITAAIARLQIALRLHAPLGAIQIFYYLFTEDDYIGSYLLILVLLVAAVPILQQWGPRLARWFGAHPVLVSGVSGVVFAAGAWFVYLRHPLAMDESSVVLQAKIFAHGALVGRYPPELLDRLVYPPFQGMFINVSRQSGEIASTYLPGFALLLTPFMWAGVPWLCNPVIGAVSVWVIHRLVLELTESEEAAGAAALITVASAAFTINSMSFYAMPAIMLCNAAFVLLLLEPTRSRCFFAGMVGGLALVLHSPLPHALFASVWLLWLFASRTDRWRLLGCVALGYLPWLSVLAGWTRLLQGLADHPAGAAAPAVAGLQWLVAMAKAFRPPAAVQWLHQLIGLAKLWLWAAPFSVLMAAIGLWRHRTDIRYRLLLASAVMLFMGYLFVAFDQGHGWGFRYFQAAWFAVPVFAAGALVPPPHPQPTGVRSMRLSDDPLTRWTLAGALCGLIVMTPYFAWQVRDFISDHLAELPRATTGEPKILFINPQGGYYSQDLIQNDPFLRDPVIRMVGHGQKADTDLIAQRYPDLVLLALSFRGSVWGIAPIGVSMRRLPATQSPASSPGTSAP
jgi:hypothetical protein